MTGIASSLIIAKLSISYDRGIILNKPKDIGLDDVPPETPDGGLVRGVGTHWRDAATKAIVAERDKDYERIFREFRRAFPVAPFDGTFILPRKGAAREFLSRLTYRPDVNVSVSEYELGVVSQTATELDDWGKRVTRQLQEVPLGRDETVSVDGLTILANLASCPVFNDKSRAALLALIQDAKLDKVNRVDFKRRLGAFTVTLGNAVAPTRKVARPKAAPEPEAALPARRRVRKAPVA